MESHYWNYYRLYKVSEIACLVGSQLSFFDGHTGQDAGRNVSLLFWFLQIKAVVTVGQLVISLSHLAEEEDEDGEEEEDDGAEDGQDDREVGQRAGLRLGRVLLGSDG